MTYEHITNETNTWTVVVDEEGILTLPEELLNRLEWKEGDFLEWEDNPDGTISLTKSSRQDYTDEELEDGFIT